MRKSNIAAWLEKREKFSGTRPIIKPKNEIDELCQKVANIQQDVTARVQNS